MLWELENNDRCYDSIIFDAKVLVHAYAPRFTRENFLNRKDKTYPLFQLSIDFGYSERFYRDGLFNTLECI